MKRYLYVLWCVFREIFVYGTMFIWMPLALVLIGGGLLITEFYNWIQTRLREYDQRHKGLK